MNKYEKARLDNMERIAKQVNNSGRLGQMFELYCRAPQSKKTAVAKQGEVDLYVKYEKGIATAEAKTNGGRIEGLRHSKVRFVIYAMNFTQKHAATKKHGAWEEKRIIDPVIIPTAVFLSALDRFHATKSTNGRNPEEAIQVSSKKFYEWLKEWPVTYDKNTRYTADDFQGLEQQAPAPAPCLDRKARGKGKH